MQHRDDTGVADEDFVRTACRRIAEKSGADIGIDHLADRAELGDEETDDHRRLACIEHLRGLLLPIGKFAHHLSLQDRQRAAQSGGDEGVFARGVPGIATEPTGKKREDEISDRALDLDPRREVRNTMTSAILASPGIACVAQVRDGVVEIGHLRMGRVGHRRSG